MTDSRQSTDGAAGGDLAIGAGTVPAQRPGLAGRRLLTRALPGGALVAAALILPEFSVGADHAGRSPAAADPPGPSPATGLDRANRGSRAAEGPFAGVRYGALLDISATRTFTASPSRGAPLDPAASSRDDFVPQPSQLAGLPAVRGGAVAPGSVGANARPSVGGSTPVTEVEQLDRAAALAASALTDFTAPRGLTIDTALATRMAAASPETVPLEQAAQYSVSVIETFVEQATARPAMAAVAPAPVDRALSASAPSASQAVAATALAALPASAPLQAAPAAPPPAQIAVAAPAASEPAQGAAVVPVPRQSPAALAPTGVSAPSAGRGMIDQVTPARIAAARPAAAPAPASAPATAPARIAPAPGPKTVTPAPAAAALAARPAPAPAPAAAVVAPRQAPALTAPTSAAGAPRIADLDFKSRLLTRVDGRSKGQVDFQQTPAGLKVRLGSVAEVLADRLPADELARIRSSSSGNAWLSLAELQAQGIPISYDPVYDEFNIGREDTRPKAARKVHIDQISAPERDDGAATMGQIPRR